MSGKVIVGDCLDVLSVYSDGVFDLIYADPPFATQRDWGQFDDRWEGGLDGYLEYMRPRLAECKRVLKPTGALYLHCDTTASHYLKVLLDTIFGLDKFRNEIVWCYAPGGRAPKRSYHRKHDVIFYYASEDGFWNAPYGPMDENTRSIYRKVDEYGRRYYEIAGRRSYLDNIPGRPVPDWWDDIHSKGTSYSSKEWVDYPTQKPLALLKRIIRASSEEDDVVLDPFCGSGTTLVAAKMLGREYVGMDVNPAAVALAEQRLSADRCVNQREMFV